MSEQAITVDANRSIIGKGTPGQWIAGAATLLAVAAVMWDARSKADQALALAEKAVNATAATQAKVDGALIELGSRLGRIEGLLEAIKAEKVGRP